MPLALALALLPSSARIETVKKTERRSRKEGDREEDV